MIYGVLMIFFSNFAFLLQRPAPLPICVECLGTEKLNSIGKEEALISCYGCGNSVHPSCRVYSADLVQHFQKEGWTCDDCKTCIVCSESQTNVSLENCQFISLFIFYCCPLLYFFQFLSSF